MPHSQATVLQTLDLNPRNEIEILYFKHQSPGQGLHPRRNRGNLWVPKGSTVSFDTIYASFFEADWYEYTALETVTLKLGIRGNFSASVFRRTFDNHTYVVGRMSGDGTDDTTLTFDKQQVMPQVPARMWIEVECLEDVEISELTWLTYDPPAQQDVRLSVCFATFNRLPYLKRVLSDLVSNEEAVSCIDKVVVINQGDRFAISDLLEPSDTDKEKIFQLVEQENLGGCGGFTRGIVESLENDAASHILLCDDDIVFEPHSIIRLSAFLKYCRDDVVVGGQMLDILRPNFLYESGATLREHDLTSNPIAHNRFLGEPETLDYLINRGKVDYNGWWYFAFSKKVVEKVALPMPCFIRGDDIEYGVRLKRNNIDTVVLPGLTVWHEPFYLKLGGWHYYYEIKNRLILKALRYEREASRDLNSIALTFLRDILTCRYYTARLAILALEDFMAGPAEALTCDPSKLAQVRGLYADYGPKPVDDYYVPTEECRPRRGGLIKGTVGTQEVRAFLMDLLPIPHRVKKYCFIPAHHFNIGNVIGYKRFIVREADHRTYLMFNRSRDKFWKLLLRFAKLYIQMLKSHNQLTREYRNSITEYTSEEHWRKLLKLPQKAPSEDPKG